MEAPARPWRCRAVLSGVVLASLALAAAGAVSAATLPNPCTLLSQVHAERTLARGKSVTVKLGKLVRTGSGSVASSTCSETVGTLPVYLILSHAAGGFGGVNITSRTHPSGLGAGDELVVGTGPTGNAVDFILFHKSNVYVDLSANGANPSSLTALARQVYKLLR